jgi:hypothetical protein
MIEIRNKGYSPVQLMVRSRKAPRSFTTKSVPGIGAQQNVILMEDEKVTDQWAVLEQQGLISTRHIPNKKNKGD